MTVLRRFRRPRWLVATGVVAVAVPAIFLVSGVTASGKPPAVSSATPVVDRDYIYGQLFDMAYSDVYRVSGADGDRRGTRARPVQRAADGQRLAGVLPALEGAAHRQEGDDRPREVRDGLGPLLPPAARAADESRTTRSTPNYRWDSDDAEVTIPGATCPGQRVLLAAHPDGTPVSPTIVGEVNNPTELDERRQRLRRRAPAPHAQQHRQRRRLRRHVGRRADDGRVPGAPALVRRERHVSVEDAEGRAARRVRRPREGRHLPARGLEVLRERTSSRRGRRASTRCSREMNANGMSYPAYHLGTQYFWNNLSNGGVGPWRTFITDTPSRAERALSRTRAPARRARTSRRTARRSRSSTRPRQRRHRRLRAAEREVRRHGSAGEPAPLQRHRLGAGAPWRRQSRCRRRRTSRPTRRPSRRSTRRCIRPGTAPEAQILSTEDDASASGTWASPASASAACRTRTSTRTRTRRRSPRRSGRRRCSAVRGRRHRLRARERRARGRDDDARRRDGRRATPTSRSPR